jgi:hypothetical protein
MRAGILILALLFATPVLAAPTCQDRNGDTIKCGAPGAMPVGWTPSPQQLWDRSRPPGPSKGELLSAFCMVALILALIALLPEADGWREDQDEE